MLVTGVNSRQATGRKERGSGGRIRAEAQTPGPEAVFRVNLWFRDGAHSQVHHRDRKSADWRG